MQLVELGKGSRWLVCAVCTAGGTCPTLEFINELEEPRAAKLMADFELYVPTTGIEDWSRRQFSKLLRDGIFEFRWARTKGGTERVLWFYDGKVIVCTHGFRKKDAKTDPAEIDRAIAFRTQYLADKAKRPNTIVSLEDFDDTSGDEGEKHG